MNAGLGWIDFSTEHRDKVHSVIEMLSVTGTVDELGIGPIRNAIADWLFPGVSTIQTRPKYFILVPQLLLSYLYDYSKGSKPISFPLHLKEREKKLMFALAKNYNYIEGEGVIGVQVAKKGGELSRKPSSIYWNGLRTHGFIKTHFSLTDYLRHFDLSRSNADSSEEDDKYSAEYSLNILTPPSLNIPDDITLDLNYQEASFLRDQFIAPGVGKEENNLLRFLLLDEENMAQTLDSSTFIDLAFNFISNPQIPADTRRVLFTALYFNFLIRGAHIRYNILLHQKSGQANFTEDWENWKAELDGVKQEVIELDLDFLFNSLAFRTPFGTQMFIRLLKREVLEDIINTSNIDNLVIRQEQSKKGLRAKLSAGSNSEEFEGWVGIRNLDYRFAEVKTIVRDIYKVYA